MDWTVIMQLISSIGFPIVACIALFTQMNKQTEQHKEEMNKISEALNNNTAALIQLAAKIDADN